MVPPVQASESVSVVICTYTPARWDSLRAAVESVERQMYAAAEVVLVIDHHAGLWERATEAFPEAIVVENRYAQGLSGARNSGIEASRGGIVAFLDDDAMADEDWLASLVSCYASPEVLGAGGSATPVWLGVKPGWFPDEFGWVVGCTYRGQPEQTAPVRNLLGCNMSFRREVFDAVGGFENGLGRVGEVPVGCEETELCIRARNHWPSGVILYEPAARVYHRVPASRGTWGYFSSRCYAEGKSKALVTQLVGQQSGLA
ncbi:MAG: glycosyltransferase, partial [Dehalococcoidia bacterium]